MSYQKGRKAETELVEWFYKLGGCAVRTPASGRATKRPLPDNIGFMEGIVYTFQVKSTKEKVVYVPKQDVLDLLEFSTLANAEAMIAARFPHSEMRIEYTGNLETTEKYFRFRKTDGMPISDIWEVV